MTPPRLEHVERLVEAQFPAGGLCADHPNEAGEADCGTFKVQDCTEKKAQRRRPASCASFVKVSTRQKRTSGINASTDGNDITTRRRSGILALPFATVPVVLASR